LRIRRRDSSKEFALGQVAWPDHGGAFLQCLEDSLTCIQAQRGLAALFVRAVAGKAAIGEERADMKVEIDFGVTAAASRAGRRGQQEEQQNSGSEKPETVLLSIPTQIHHASFHSMPLLA